MEDSITTLYIGKYSEAELGTGTTYLVFVPELEQAELPNKLYLPMILNGAGTGNSAPQVGPGFYLTHPITPNQESITWRMYYYAGETRVAMRVAEMPVSQPQPTPTPQPYPAPTPTQSTYQENIFDRLVAFLKDLFDVKAVSAAPLTVDAPVGEVYFLLTDYLGSTTMTVNVNGSVKAETRYGAWGNTRYTSGTNPTDRKYTGQIEEASGLYFYNARWYDPYITQFTQPDSIIPDSYKPLDWNRYSYARNNPLIYTDPSGHFPWLLVGILAFMVVNLTGDTASLPNYPINASSSDPCNSSLSDCFGDVVKLDDFSGNGEDNPIPIEEFNAFADEVASDLNSHDLTWPGFLAGRHAYDTPFYNGGESSARTGVEGSELGLYPSNQQVCIETIGCSGRSEINYLAQGMWGAATNEPKFVSHGIAYAWKWREYDEPPSEDVLFWIDYGYDYYRQWKENQK